MSFELTPDQESAKNTILSFLKNEDKHILLYGAAGTGKSRLVREIVDQIRLNYTVAGVAPTHKARKILDRFLNTNSFMTIKTMTVASLLNKLRVHSYVGTKKYKSGIDSKMNAFDIFFIDEVSMITDDDYDKLLHFAELNKKKIIFIGDKYQIPNPSQIYIKNKDNSYSKKDSKAFDSDSNVKLSTIVRQDESNPLIDIYLQIKKAIDKNCSANYPRKSKKGIIFYDEKDKWYEKIKEVYKNLEEFQFHSTRILAYTNEAVRNHNMVIRKLFNRGSLPEPGELVMGYNTIGYPDPVVENSQDYYIKSIKPTEKYTIEHFSELSGYILSLQEVESEKISIVFLPDLTNPKNYSLLQELIKRSEKVNSKFSTKDDFKKYMNMKNKMIFMENIYKYKDQIISERQFQISNPLLFKSVSEVIVENEDERAIVDNKLVKDIKNKYPGLLEKRYEDDKLLTEIEKLSDSFQVIDKDLDYGYAITVHKSQGSSFDSVFIDEADIEKIRDSWSYKLDALIKGSKEQNQLKYVAYTRPKFEAFVYYREAIGAS